MATDQNNMLKLEQHKVLKIVVLHFLALPHNCFIAIAIP